MKKIYTVTLSPALDVEYHTDKVSMGLNRTRSHTVSAGGKGVNVSRAIAGLMKKYSADASLNTVFACGGETGELLRLLIEKDNLGRLYPVRCDLPTRVNTSLIPDSGEEIEINAPGTPVGDGIYEIEKTVLSGIGNGDVVCVCGSVPSDVGKDYPAKLCAKIKKAGGVAVLDCDGEALKIAAEAEPESAADLIKPNLSELSALVVEDLSDITPEKFAGCCASLPFSSVIMTMAGDGAMYYSKGEYFTAAGEKKRVVRLKGAGDTFLGAYVFARYVMGEDSRRAVEFAVETAGKYVAGEI